MQLVRSLFFFCIIAASISQIFAWKLTVWEKPNYKGKHYCFFGNEAVDIKFPPTSLTPVNKWDEIKIPKPLAGNIGSYKYDPMPLPASPYDAAEITAYDGITHTGYITFRSKGIKEQPNATKLEKSTKAFRVHNMWPNMGWC